MGEQTEPLGVVPQETRPPQPSLSTPQILPAGHVVAGVHGVLDGGTHLLPSAEHTRPALQFPQAIVPLQPLACTPQTRPALQRVRGTQSPAVHVLPSTLQDSPAGQVPQEMYPPQPSEACPQIWLAGHVVFGEHPGKGTGTHAVWSALQVVPSPHEPAASGGPHVIVPPHPSSSVPQTLPAVHSALPLQGGSLPVGQEPVEVQVWPLGHVPHDTPALMPHCLSMQLGGL